MAKESSRKCSHCGNNGHNSRTCNEKVGMKLFGVKILTHRGDESIKKSFSMGNLQSCVIDQNAGDPGYLSDGLIHSRRASHERKKGVPWTEEEHRTFLAGLEKLGKGDWRGISRNFVTSRTPTQVASHAQKYFLRQTASNKKKRRASLFDVPVRDPAPTLQIAPALPIEVHERLGTSAQITTQVANLGLESSPFIPVAANCGVPNIHGIPYMVKNLPEYLHFLHFDEFEQGVKTPLLTNLNEVEGVSSGTLNYPAAKIFPAVSFVPVMNFPNQDYAYLAKSYNYFDTCSPIASQASSNPLAQSVPHGSSQAEPGTSSTESTDLELSIAPPRTHNATKLRSRPSNFGGAIRVV
ncbi:hypothetical protein HHK36_000904 [Tetracentron sinense]|uniref:Uncharacterized protein n=1 Tax=Tetracentron sinense TaxID=13715 RepID=A0A834ZUZ5_TETSI|nr:hypothetical protein HHK36_000904 [Tetracentron sinense]